MIRKSILVMLTSASILLALGSMLSHWHAMRFGKVWDTGYHVLIVQGGDLGWELRLHRDKAQWRGVGVRRFDVPFLFEFFADDDGRRSIRISGLRVGWTRQPGGYRSYDAWIQFFECALVAVLYPTISLASHRIRRWRRKRKGLCPRCAYDLRGSIDRCPECGAAIE